MGHGYSSIMLLKMAWVVNSFFFFSVHYFLNGHASSVVKTCGSVVYANHDLISLVILWNLIIRFENAINSIHSSVFIFRGTPIPNLIIILLKSTYRFLRLYLLIFIGFLFIMSKSTRVSAVAWQGIVRIVLDFSGIPIVISTFHKTFAKVQYALILPVDLLHELVIVKGLTTFNTFVNTIIALHHFIKVDLANGLVVCEVLREVIEWVKTLIMSLWTFHHRPELL